MKRFSVPTILFALIICGCAAQAQVSFLQPPLYSGGGYAQFIADFNGDGKPDILTSDGTLNLGNGDGTFTLGTSLSNTSVPILAVADFNGDGKPDVLEYTTGTLLVLLGNGDGTFQAPISTSSNASLSGFAIADLNGDGKADVVGVSSSTLFVYISNGDGTFKPGVQYNSGATATQSPFFGDFNGDGNTDVAIQLSPNQTNVNLVVLLGNGDGTFQTTPKTSTSAGGTYFVVGDFNGDGKVDVATSSGSPCPIAETCEVYVQLGNGDGTFQAPAAAFSGAGPLATADLARNGKLDLVLITSIGPNPLTVQIYLGNGDATFSSPVSYGVSLGGGGGALGAAINVADFNGDGKLDIAAGGILLGNGDGTFKGIPLAVLPNFPIAIAVGDFEKKGALDVAALLTPSVANGSNSLSFLSNNGSGALSLIHTYALQQADAAIVTADFNGDGKLDLALLGTDPTTQNWSYSVLLGNGDGSFQSPVTYPQTGPVPNSFVVTDFNGDHKPDLAFAFYYADASTNDSVGILLGKGDGTFAPPVYYYAAGPGDLLVADFNGDGKTDIAFCSSIGTGILYGNGDGTFQAAVFPSNLTSFCPYLTADVNDDGNADLIDFHGDIALGNGDDTFTELPPLTVTNGSYQVTALADFNGDGKLDLLGTFYLSPPGDHPTNTAIILGNGDGTFGSLINAMPNGVIAFSSVSADMNGDGLPDIVLPWANYQGLCSPCFGTSTGVGVLMNTTNSGPPQPDFQMFHSGLSPTPVIAGSSATATITAAPSNGFTGNVALSCTGLASGIGCSFNPASITSASGTSTVTVSTTSGLQAGTYTVVVSGVSGSISHIAALTLTVTAQSGGSPDFQVSASSASPGTVTAGNSATSILTVASLNGFNSAVALTCASGVSGVTCSIYPTSVTPSGGTSPTSTLTINTTSGAVLGTHSVTIFGTSGGTVHSIGVTLTVQAAHPDFTVGAASGSPTSQTIGAGQTATFSLAFVGTAGFSGTVNLSCVVTPAVTLSPTCNLSSSSVQISTTTSQTVTVNVGTTASTTISTGPCIALPPGAMLPSFMLSGLALLFVRGRRRLSALATPAMAIALLCMSCGGGSSHHTTPGTPPGTYSATVIASSGSLTHNVSLHVIVQ